MKNKNFFPRNLKGMRGEADFHMGRKPPMLRKSESVDT